MKNKISVVIITLGRKTLYTTLDSLFIQDIYEKFEIILILQGKINKEKINISNTKNIPIKIFNYKHGLGVGYYRNEGIKKSSGNIITFIDDDEWTKNNKWLEALTKPIIEKKYLVATAGTEIPITKSYIANSISLLGYPGGGNVGFSNMWSVNKKEETQHLCSGNFAYDRSINIQFNNKLKSASEDVDFAKQIVDKEIKIKYVKNATIYHKPRFGIINFIRWQYKRGKSINEYKKESQITKQQIIDKKKSIKNIIKKSIYTRYSIGIILLLITQYTFNILGYIKSKYFER